MFKVDKYSLNAYLLYLSIQFNQYFLISRTYSNQCADFFFFFFFPPSFAYSGRGIFDGAGGKSGRLLGGAGKSLGGAGGKSKISGSAIEGGRSGIVASGAGVGPSMSPILLGRVAGGSGAELFGGSGGGMLGGRLVYKVGGFSYSLSLFSLGGGGRFIYSSFGSD